MEFIPISQPSLTGNEKKYVNDCIDTNWISSLGSYIEKFEKEFAKYCNTKHAISCNNGTSALHLVLLALGINKGDEVILPTLTFVATANVVLYCGAKPVFVDCDPDTWNINVDLIENLITPKTKAIIPVHLYGHPVDMGPVIEIAKKYKLFVVEDAAESHGAEYKGKKVGSLGDIAIFSFFGNKIITCGEGGMIVTNNDEIAEKIQSLKNQGMSKHKRYWFPQLGYNYRMTNIQAAIGLAQLEKIDWHVKRRIEIAKFYQKEFSNIPDIKMQPEKKYAKNVYWMNNIIVGHSHKISRDELMIKLKENNIDSRPFFYPLHTLPYMKKYSNKKLFISEKVAALGLTLPTFSSITNSQLVKITSILKNILI